MKEKKIIIFTDLDGTLLDRNTYSYKESQHALEMVKSRGIPVIFCSAKTRAEQEVYRSELEINDPFIVENGGAIFIPKGYFPFSFMHDKSLGELLIIELGIPYVKIREILVKVRDETSCDFKGYGDMSVQEVAQLTGLDNECAKRAKQREYDETLEFYDSDEKVNKCLQRMKNYGLNFAHGGRFYNIMGPNDKGKAVTIVKTLYQRLYGSVETIGLGDSFNDLPMLSAVDIPMLVQKPGGIWEKIELANLHRIEGIGPVGWKKAIEELIEKLSE